MSILKTRTYYKYLLLAIGYWLLAYGHSLAQSNLRTKALVLNKDTIQLDTLSIIPGTLSVQKQNGEPLDLSYYRIDHVNALIIRALPLPEGDTLLITYKTFPFFFSQKHQHKDIRKIQNNQFGEPYVYTVDKNQKVDFFKTEGLSKSGSISRGLSFGNNQDVVLNSNLNLQLAGKLSDNMDILLAATDQNIPVQPEGNTQQLQEFDKVFIQIGIKDAPKNGKTTVTAGDFQIGKPNGYFMNFNKKLQGLSFSSEVNGKRSHPDSYRGTRATASAAVSKGKFAKNISAENSNGNTFNGQKQEKNQGAYKLRGAENEQFIIVLGGTETVYLDGRLLERGQENDYVIDYNTAEITFTPKNLITKDKRIAVEFQYSDKNYARSLVHAGTEYESKKLKARVNVYTEQDNKNRPLQQQLEDPQKLLLSSIGDSLQDALSPSADSIPFNSTEILYNKMDSTHGTFFYPGIYVYSTDSANAHYRLSFSFVGANRGNYKLKQSSANGKVFEWVLPDTVTGQPQGSYEPVTLLITPKQKQMLTAGFDINLSKNSKLSIEGGMSKNDINTFSHLEKKNDQGFGGKLNWDSKLPLGQGTRDTGQVKGAWAILTNVNYEYLQKTFSAIERFRSVEFERDWNRGNVLQMDDQHIIGGRIGLAKKENIVAYDYRSLLEGSFYNGMRHGTNVNLLSNGFLLSGDASYLDSKTSLNSSDFFRHRATLSKEIKLGNKKLKAGIREQQEQNHIRSMNVDSLIPGSGRFIEWEPFIELRDSANNKYTLNYKQRTDYALSSLSGAELHRATHSEDYGGGIELFSNPNNQFRITGSYRRLSIVDSNLTSVKPENTIIGRTEYNFSLLKGFFTSHTFYEVGSGLELKKDFLFLEVAAGQGTHIWKDYNSDGIKQLNEFEISLFPNEANYIKMWVPSDDYISTFTNQFSEVFSIRPAAKWGGKKGFKKLVSRFANQTAYRTDRKTTNSDIAVAYNPFLSDTKDSTLVSLNSSLRNTVYFNQNDAVFGMDFTWQDVQNKTLLVNDTTFRTNTSTETKARWNLNRSWTLQGSFKNGVKENNSRFFTARNYRINYFEIEPKVSLQSSSSVRIILSYKYSKKENGTVFSFQHDEAIAQNLGSELKYSALNKGSLTARVNFILINFNGTDNSAIGYEMLEGLKTGQNYTWNVGYSRTLASNIQLTLSYDGRQSPGIKTVHTGNAQVRAFF